MAKLCVQQQRKELLSRLERGETLKKICSDQRMPNYEVVLRWSRENDDFHAAYVEARDAFSHHHADECLEIADELALTSGDKDTVADVQRAELKIKTRQWLANHYCPSRFSERRAIRIKSVKEKEKNSERVETVIAKMAEGEISAEDAGKILAALHQGQKIVLEGEKQQETEERIAELEKRAGVKK